MTLTLRIALRGRNSRMSAILVVRSLHIRDSSRLPQIAASRGHGLAYPVDTPRTIRHGIKTRAGIHELGIVETPSASAQDEPAELAGRRPMDRFPREARNKDGNSSGPGGRSTHIRSRTGASARMDIPSDRHLFWKWRGPDPGIQSPPIANHRSHRRPRGRRCCDSQLANLASANMHLDLH